MDGDWLTYRQLAEKLGTSAEGARRRAQRGRWTRQRGNDGQARVLVPEDIQIELNPVRAPSGRTDGAGEKSAQGAHLVAALEAHVETLKAELEHRAAEIDALKAQLAGAEARASDEAAKTTQTIAAVEAHNATLKADIEKLEALHAAERQRADKAIAGFEALLRTESERADRAIAAFESLARRLEAMAEAKRPPWWRWLRFAD